MSSKPNPSPTPAPSRAPSRSQTFSRQKPKPGDRAITSEAILRDLAEFKKRGGRIDVLGNTPLRTSATSAAFHSRSTAANKKPPTPLDEADKSDD